MNEKHPTRPLPPLGALAVASLAAGLLAWLWLGEWRWAATGLVALLVLVAASAALDGRKNR